MGITIYTSYESWEFKDQVITLRGDDPVIVDHTIYYLYRSSYDDLPPLDAIVHAKVYAIAEKYRISPLEDLARENAKVAFQKHWNVVQFPALVDIIWNTTPETGKRLQDAVIDFTVQPRSEILEKKLCFNI